MFLNPIDPYIIPYWLIGTDPGRGGSANPDRSLAPWPSPRGSLRDCMWLLRQVVDLQGFLNPKP